MGLARSQVGLKLGGFTVADDHIEVKRKRVREAMDAVRARVQYLTKRVRSGNADVKKARQKQEHFDDLAKEWNKKREAAQKEERPQNAERAKRKARRAIRKAAYWDEVGDDAEQGRN